MALMGVSSNTPAQERLMTIYTCIRPAGSRAKLGLAVHGLDVQ
jgi:hypothetical protein